MKIGGHSALFLDEFWIGIRRQCKTKSNINRMEATMIPKDCKGLKMVR